MSAIRIVLVDDQYLVRAGLRALLERATGISVVGDTALGSVQVIMLTTFDDDEYLFEAIRAGAAGFPQRHRARHPS
jgi:DNA-binding NarL/FixJ family response regulator